MTEAVEPSDVDLPDALRFAVLSFSVDRITAEVTRALEDASIESIVIKGPAIATWLYGDDIARLYTDTDLLIRRRDWAKAMETLDLLGFQDDLGPMAHPRMESGAGHLWARVSDNAEADLHYTLFGIGAKPEELWEAFSEDAVREPIGGVEVSMPSHAARLLHIALHAVQHGGEAQVKPMADLKTALAKVPEETWSEALELANRLDAEDTFAAGLRLTKAGRELAESIGVGGSRSVDGDLRLGRVPMAEGVREFVETPGMRGKIALLVRELFPSRTFMRWWSPLARRGTLGMVLAYLWRPLRLAYRAVPAFRAWRRVAGRQHATATAYGPSTAPPAGSVSLDVGSNGNGAGPSPSVADRTIEERLDREREFHDRLAEELAPELMPPAELDELEQAMLRAAGDLRGKRVLDLGCGSGDLTLTLARAGARIVAVDLSPGMVAVARKRLSIFARGAEARFEVAAAEELPLEDDSIDIVIGRFILHHLDVPMAARECSRVLAPDGKALFVENSSRNRLLMFARNHLAGRFGIPRYGTPDERPLCTEDLQELGGYFPRMDVEYPVFDFFTLFDRQILHHRWERATNLMRAIDRAIWRWIAIARPWSFRILVVITV